MNVDTSPTILTRSKTERKYFVQANDEVVFLRIVDGTKVLEFTLNSDNARKMAGSLHAAARHVDYQKLAVRPGSAIIRKIS